MAFALILERSRSKWILSGTHSMVLLVKMERFNVFLRHSIFHILVQGCFLLHLVCIKVLQKIVFVKQDFLRPKEMLSSPRVISKKPRFIFFAIDIFPSL